MGYTNYWTPKASTPEKFKEFAHVCRLLKDACNVSITGYDGKKKTKPIFSEKEVRFNGIEEDGHETFSIESGFNEWTFCKTARKPYDLLVCAILLAAQNMLGFKISSDGDIIRDGTLEYHDPCNWEKARKIYESLIV